MCSFLEFIFVVAQSPISANEKGKINQQDIGSISHPFIHYSTQDIWKTNDGISNADSSSTNTDASRPKSAQFLRHFVVAVSSIVLHVVPKVDSNALVALSNVMIPQARQIQNVSGIDAHFENGRFIVIRVFFEAGFKRIDANPLEFNGFSVI